MAEVRKNNNTTSSAIKLFGATISPKQKPQQPNDIVDDTEKPDDHHDPTAEKRPEKIIPCPRCKSTETKFCYFNNYNVNQPRHFCKGCQRYWTAGGALRNVPVGAGRRKTKPPCRGSSPEGCFYDPSVRQLDFDAVVEGWQAAEHGGYGDMFSGKRRRCGPDSQRC